MLLDDDRNVVPLLPRDRAPQTRSAADAGRARTPGPGRDTDADELARLRRRVAQQDHALARLSEALMALRRGSEALRAENRELRAQAEAARLARQRYRLS